MQNKVRGWYDDMVSIGIDGYESLWAKVQSNRIVRRPVRKTSTYLGFGFSLGAEKRGLVDRSLVRGKGNGGASRKDEDGSRELHGVVANLSGGPLLYEFDEETATKHRVRT